jgi:DNA replication protein DnaC
MAAEPAPANRHDELGAMLRSLNLSHTAKSFADLALRASKATWTHEAFLHEVVRQECEYRTQRRVARLLHQSGLPREKTFRIFQLEPLGPILRLQLERLRRGGFIEEATNVIAVGKPGAGKSHLLAALGHDLILLGQPVLWISTAALVQQLLAAKRDLRLPQELAKLDRFACVFLDDIGYVQQDRDEMEVLFTFLDDTRRHRPRRPPRRHPRHDGHRELPRQGGAAGPGPARASGTNPMRRGAGAVRNRGPPRGDGT